jgi:uncharacterized protein YndB with AHSA1/START domain
MFVVIAIAVGVLLAALLGYAATRPDTFRVQRSQSMQTPPDRIFELIDDFHKWASWSPYEKLDPAMKKTFSGARSGKGAVYMWAGNSKAGEGRMEILDTVPASKTTIKLDFLKPFEGHNTAEFTLDARGGATEVTWAMYGPQPYMFKLMSVFFSMDKMVGKAFSAGLVNLKAIAESQTVISN